MPNIKELEASMRPGKLSQGGFLGVNESLEKILHEDDFTVKRLSLTHDKIADRLEHFILAVDAYPSTKGKIVDGKYLVRGFVSKGIQLCPWNCDSNDPTYNNIDLIVKNTEINEGLSYPGLIVHLIRKHHFYEGKQSPYRVDPEKVVRVLGVR